MMIEQLFSTFKPKKVWLKEFIYNKFECYNFHLRGTYGQSFKLAKKQEH
jgi:hypothetical protein